MVPEPLYTLNHHQPSINHKSIIDYRQPTTTTLIQLTTNHYYHHSTTIDHHPTTIDHHQPLFYHIRSLLTANERLLTNFNHYSTTHQSPPQLVATLTMVTAITTIVSPQSHHCDQQLEPNTDSHSRACFSQSLQFSLIWTMIG